MSDRCCYVGPLAARQPGVPGFYAVGIHPRDFAAYVAKLTCDVWTNNPLIVECFPFDRVIVCDREEVEGGWHDRRRRLDQHPSFAKWKDCVSPGELWSIVGEAWVWSVP